MTSFPKRDAIEKQLSVHQLIKDYQSDRKHRKRKVFNP